MTNRPIKRPVNIPRAEEPRPHPQAQSASPKPPSSAPHNKSAEFFAAQKNSSDQEVLVRKRKRRENKRKKHVRTAVIVAVALALVGGGAAFAVMNTINSGKAAIQETAQADDIQTSENAVTYDEGKTVKYNGHTYAYNENIVSVCIIGYDRTAPAEVGEKAGQADAVMIMALDTVTGEITAIGIPRDSMVEVGEFVGEAFIGLDKMQLCLAYSYGDGRDTSCQYTANVASRVLYNMPISYYFAIDLSGIGPLNDAVGGVSLTPLQSIPNTNVIEGQDTVLFGNNALRYVQWRDTSVLTSSLDRQARQVQYIKAFAAEALQLSQGSAGTLLDLYNTASEYSITNLGINEFSYLATSVLQSGVSSLEVTTLPGEMQQGEKYAEFYLDKSAVYETVLDTYYTQTD